MTLFTDVMTVYNYINDENGERWQRSVVKGVQWSHNQTRLSTNGNVQTEQRVESITVDFDRSYGNPTYVNPIEFAKLPDKSGYWTLNEADAQDVLVLGETDVEVGDTVTISDLATMFQYTGIATEVSDNRNRRRLRTIKVVCK